MKKAIIHLSDLHVTFHKNSDGVPITSFDVNLTTTPNDDLSISYVNAFINKINEVYKDYTLFLIVSGDIADKGLEAEFTFANFVLNKLRAELKIEKENILIVPGDHDVNWNDALNAFEQLENKEGRFAYQFHNEKFKKFKNFYDAFYDLNSLFNPENQIVNHLALHDDKILFVGFNSNNRVGTRGADGYVDIEKVTLELDSLLSSFNDYSKIAVFHHNFIANYEKSYKGEWEGNNLVAFKSLLQKKQFVMLIYGNEHTSSSEDKNQLIQSAVGSFGKTKPNPSFKVYIIVKEFNDVKLKNELWGIINHAHTNNHQFGFWSEINDSPNELKYFVLRETKKITQVSSTKNIEIPFEFESSEKFIAESEYKDYFFNLIKQKKIFHSGHFHWSETSRAHNWIDISKILNDRKDLFLAKEAIIDIIEKNGLVNKFDFIIGLGIEGNILSTRASVKYNKPYTFLPYSYRYDEHNEYEKKLNFENNGEYKSVLIITDVVNDGRTIRKLIHKKDRATEFFKSVKNILVISLFYTGDKNPITNDILNNDNQDSADDHLEKRIKYYFVLDMKVEKCPYKSSDYRNECLIVREKLGCVHNFYDEEKAFLKLINSTNSVKEKDS